MMKKTISLFLALLMLAMCLSGCDLFGSSDEESTDGQETGSETVTNEEKPSQTQTTTEEQASKPSAPTFEGTGYPINNTATWLKKLDPRMQATADHITCDWSASGIEFTATVKGDISFEVNTTTKMGGGKYGCYFRAYVDGEAYLNGDSPYYELQSGIGKITLKDIPEGTHTVRLVKVSGYTLANVELKTLYLNGTVSETAPTEKELYIEFVGDSMSCGWGVVGDHQGAYTDQDATLAYPYLVSQALNADYSVVAVSGQGIIKGNPGITGGYRYPSPYRSTEKEYDFARKANVIVINADTNDAYSNYSTEVYREALEDFLRYVREKNGTDAHVILVCNMMKTNYTKTIENLVKDLGGAENRYYYYKAVTAKGVYSAHPTAEENVVYASEIGGMISAILEGSYNDGTAPSPDQFTDCYEESFVSHIKPLAGGTVTPEFANGTLNVNTPSWGNSRYQLVGRDVFATAPEKTMLEMKVDFKKIGTFALILNAQADDPNGSRGAIVVSLRLGTAVNAYTSANESTPIDGTKNLYVSAGVFKIGDGGQNLGLANELAVAVPSGATNVSIQRLTVVVENLEVGCRVYVYIDGQHVADYTLNDNGYRIAANSYIALWAQKSECSIDDLKVCTVEGAVTADAVPTAGTVLHENQFELSQFGVGKTPEYNQPALKVDDKGKLFSTGGAWKSHSCTVANGATYSDHYVADFQMDLTTAGVSLLLFNNAGSATTAADFHKYAFAIRFEWSNNTGFGFFVRKYDEKGAQISTNLVEADALISDFEGLDYRNFKLTVEVDSTPADGCKITVYANDQLMTSFTLDNNYDVKADNAIEFWTQGTCSIGIDSISVKNFKKAEN